MTTKKVTYKETKDASIRVINNLIEMGILEDNDNHYFDVQDMVQDEFNEILGLEI